MKIKIAALTVACFALLASACGSSPSKEEVVNTTTTAPKATTTIPKTTTTSAPLIDAYVEVMRDYFPGASRSELIDLGKTACEVIDESGSITSALISIATDPSWAGMEEMAGYTIGVSVPVFCPRYMPELNRITQ